MSELALREFTEEQVDLIRRTVANGATNDELKLFLYHAQRTGLDPLARQIHFHKRKSKDGPARAVIQTAIDGYRLIADRTGKYAGNDDPEFSQIAQAEGGSEYPLKATVTVWKLAANGQRVPFTASARWREYYPGEGKPGFMWRKMPFLMLGKVAESLALRKAFPAELSGIYTAEEMQQSETESEWSEPTASDPQPPASPEQADAAPSHDPDDDWSQSAASPLSSPSHRDEPLDAAQAETGAEATSSDDATAVSAPVPVDIWDRIDRGVKAGLLRENSVRLKARRIALDSENAPIPDKFGDVGKMRLDLLQRLAAELHLDEKVPV